MLKTLENRNIRFFNYLIGKNWRKYKIKNILEIFFYIYIIGRNTYIKCIFKLKKVENTICII